MGTSQLNVQKTKIEKLLSRFKTSIIKDSLNLSTNQLFEKLTSPEVIPIISQDISDFNHDIEMLCLIEDGIEAVIRVGKLGY